MAIHSNEAITSARVKWTNPIYSHRGWKRPNGKVEVITLMNRAIELPNR